MKAQTGKLLESFRVLDGYFGSDRTYGFNGAFDIASPTSGMFHVVCSNGEGWEHVSVSLPDRCPTWDEMCWIKNLFWDEHECVVQFHPPKSAYVNMHPHCLHLWKPTVERMPTPPSWMVGLRADEKTVVIA